MQEVLGLTSLGSVDKIDQWQATQLGRAEKHARRRARIPDPVVIVDDQDDVAGLLDQGPVIVTSGDLGTQAYARQGQRSLRGKHFENLRQLMPAGRVDVDNQRTPTRSR